MMTVRSAASRAKHRQGFVAGLAHMHDQRQPHASRQLDLRAEGVPLGLPRREVAIEVEPALADGDDLRLPRQDLQISERRRLARTGIVGVQSYSRIHAGKTGRERDREP